MGLIICRVHMRRIPVLAWNFRPWMNNRGDSVHECQNNNNDAHFAEVWQQALNSDGHLRLDLVQPPSLERQKIALKSSDINERARPEVEHLTTFRQVTEKPVHHIEALIGQLSFAQQMIRTGGIKKKAGQMRHDRLLRKVPFI
eukprot:4941776-Amphidinium_carterae.1